MTAPAAPAPAAPSQPRWVLPAIGAGIVCLVIASNTGNAVWASWVDDRPYGLLALNSSNKFILATSPNVTLWVAVVISTLRLLAPDPLFYLLGRLYRDRALHWARTAFPGATRLLDEFESDRTGFRSVLNVLVVVAPNNVVCLLAGVNRFPVRRFVVLNVVGTVGRVLLMQWIGWIFRDEIEDLLDVVARYQRWLLWGSVAAVVAYVTWQVVSRRGLIGGVEELEDELGDPR